MIYIVKDFVDNTINPITNRPYDDSWIVFCLTDSSEYQMMTGGGVDSVYTVKVSRQNSNWMMSLCDFVEFHESNNKNIILSVDHEDLQKAKNYYAGHHYNDDFLRDGEPDVLIHSTTLSNWTNIKKDGYLKSWNSLKLENKILEDSPIGKILGDPADFSDYIMFSGGEISSEIVVLSKQLGSIRMNPDMQYTTGVRLYFDIKRIAKEGLLERDGCHLKVKHKLPLYPYLLWVADWKNVGLKSPISTPKEYTEICNSKFNELLPNLLCNGD